MKIQIIHSRDPDSECFHRIFVDDVELKHWAGTLPDGVTVEIEDLDPGRGYDDADWDERTADADDGTAFGAALAADLAELRPVQRKFSTGRYEDGEDPFEGQD